MFLLLLILGTTLAADPTPLPTIPTYYPTITPAPESNCAKIQADDEGPFPLDCLQQEFIAAGCSVRGHAYPTETSFLLTEFNKEVYNGKKWSEVLDLFETFDDTKADTTKDECLGTDTDQPTPDPTPLPTTLKPTPAPTVRTSTDDQTPAPVFAEDTPFRNLIIGDDAANTISGSEADTAAKLKKACIDRGFQREYDETEYVIQVITTTDGVDKYDYYTTATEDDVRVEGNTGGICELLGGDFTKPFYWSDRHDGPFQLVTVHETSGKWTIGAEVDDCTTTGDQRVFPRWIAPDSAAGGYYTAAINDGATAGNDFMVKVASKRTHQPCREHKPPQTTAVKGLNQSLFSTRCQRAGRNGQNWNHDSASPAVECDGTNDDEPKDNWALHYAIANNRFSNCESECVYGMDYNPTGGSKEEKETLFWSWQKNSGAQCWQRRTEITPGTFDKCDYAPTVGDASEEATLGYDQATKEMDLLCAPRCDYAQGWYLGGDVGEYACYQVVTTSEYDNTVANRLNVNEEEIIFNPDDFGTNPEKGVGLCNARLRNGVFGDDSNEFGVATQASINSVEEAETMALLCNAPENSGCYFCGIDEFDTNEAECADGRLITFTAWKESESKARADTSQNNMILDTNEEWQMRGDSENISVLCSAPANFEEDDNGRATATTCAEELSMPFDDDTSDPHSVNDGTSDGIIRDKSTNEKSSTVSYPELDVDSSGFTLKDTPGTLVMKVNVPRTMYNVYISFENSTNDEADYNWQWDNDLWEVAPGADCGASDVYTGKFDWTMFNLGGAGGVQRLETYEVGRDESTRGEKVDQWELNEVPDRGIPSDNTVDIYELDTREQYYQFGSVVRIEAQQPLLTVEMTKDTETTHTNRNMRNFFFTRDVIVRMPFIIRFQKTITVHTDTNIVSTKFNYKTVAAIIQSVQHSTQYFAPPYAKLRVQIRTKSQYPYRFQHNEDPGSKQDSTTVTLHTANVLDTGSDPDNTMVNLGIDWLVDDVNCTFTNPDHMREGDICVQEWMLHIEPLDSVCYATGEYSIEYKTTCFHGKDVCYLPKDSDNKEIDTVTFTFKIQTSKFCPVVADEVDLDGTLTVTGRNSFKPDEECTDPSNSDVDARDCVEGDTAGSFYMQGETIFLIARTVSAKATIRHTSIYMVELEQDLTGLVQTGYNRVPYDKTLEDTTIWTCTDHTTGGACADAGRVADGTLNISDDDNSPVLVELIKDEEVYSSEQDFLSPESGKEGYTFDNEEAGFKILLHARAFPVNVDSFGSKRLVATLAVEYTDLNRDYTPDDRRRRRRRLISAHTNARSIVNFGVRAFEPKSFPNGLGKSASFAMVMTMDSKINRKNVLMFTHSLKQAIVTALNEDSIQTVYSNQVSVDKVISNGVSIWEKTDTSSWDARRLEVSSVQRIETHISFGKVNRANSMSLSKMIEVFEKQIKSPSSPLMHQPVFYGAIVHDVHDLPNARPYEPIEEVKVLNGMESSAFAVVPFALFALLSALL